MTNHVVYFIRQRDTDLYKVGFTGNIEKRLRQLQLGSGRYLETVLTIETSTPRELESYLHKKLRTSIAGRQKAVHTEWFFIAEDWLPVLLFELRMKCPVYLDIGDLTIRNEIQSTDTQRRI